MGFCEAHPRDGGEGIYDLQTAAAMGRPPGHVRRPCGQGVPEWFPGRDEHGRMQSEATTLGWLNGARTDTPELAALLKGSTRSEPPTEEGAK